MFIKNKYLIITIAFVGVAGCKQVPLLPGIGPHKIDIQQGNVVTQEMVAKLQPGMTRSQVRFALGTPLLVDPFRADRWDYFYSYMKRGDLIEQRRLVVFFKDDKLDRLEGDVVAAKPASDGAGAEKLKPVPEPAKPVGTGESTTIAKPVEKPAAAKPEAKAQEKPKEERGFFGRMLDKIGL